MNTKKRINLSVSDDINSILKTLAQRDSVPVTTKALELLKGALETEEDIILDEIVSRRDKKDAKYISHEEVWK